MDSYFWYFFYQSTLNRVWDDDVSDQLCLYRWMLSFIERYSVVEFWPKKVLDVVLSRSKKRLKDDLIHHVYQNITEEDCSYGVVYLLHQIFAKVLNHRDLDSACGTDGREDLKTLIRVSDLLFYKTCHKKFAQEIS